MRFNQETVDYAMQFKYKSPTPIRGPPTHKALKRLQTELQANASSIECELGGGDHGYLGLVLDDADYASVPGTVPFVPPGYPPVLVIPAGATAVEALQLQEDHHEAKRAYLECKNVEKALLRFIQDALEDRFIEGLLDEYTGLITMDIPDVLTYLFDTYGSVTSDEVDAKQEEIMKTPWQPTDPLVLITRPLERLQKLSDKARIRFTDAQILEKGLQKIRQTRDFESALERWENKRPALKTWDNFKSHFQSAQVLLKKTRGPTMQQAGLHHANMLAETIRSDIQNEFDARNQEMLSYFQSLSEGASHAPSQTGTETSPLTENSGGTPGQQVDSANALSQQDYQIKTLQLLEQISKNMNCKPAQSDQDKKQPRKTPDDATFPRRITNLYCWTHGGCNHLSKDCKRRARGHKTEATFENRLGGSAAYCST